MPQFLQETIPTAFKSRTVAKRKGSFNDSDLFDRVSCSPKRGSKLPPLASAAKEKTVSGVVQINTSMLSEKTVMAVCDTLRRFQQKIKVVELYHNLAAKGGAGSSTSGGQNSPSVSYRLSSP